LTTDRLGIFLRNKGSDIIYIGNSGSVTVANGYPINPGQTIQFIGTGALYGIVPTTTSDMHFIEVTV
jgi:hypothetical protein